MSVTTRIGRLSEVPATPGYHGDPAFAGREERQLAKRVGLTQFGVNRVALAPGAATARRHWHEAEDEFVQVLAGEVILRDDAGEHVLRAGDFAGFPAGEPNAHHLFNASDAPAELIVVGLRKVGEERIHYPDAEDPGPFVVRRDARGERVK